MTTNSAGPQQAPDGKWALVSRMANSELAPPTTAQRTKLFLRVLQMALPATGIFFVHDHSRPASRAIHAFVRCLAWRWKEERH